MVLESLGEPKDEVLEPVGLGFPVLVGDVAEGPVGEARRSHLLFAEDAERPVARVCDDHLHAGERAAARAFEDGVLAAVNLGDDADTTAAIYGQLAGALYGADAIPERWLDKLVMRDRIIELADELFALSGTISPDESPLPGARV